MKYLHLGPKASFIPPYFKFLGRNFDIREHVLLARPVDGEWPTSLRGALLEKSGLSYVTAFLRLSFGADKIILHGLFDIRVIGLLVIQPWLLRKCVWVLWGGDLYGYRNRKEGIKNRVRHLVHKSVVKRLGLIITTVPGDYELACQWYGTRAEFIECLMYESHLARTLPLGRPESLNRELVIQVGNSADPENSHRQVFEKIAPYVGQGSVVVVPLTYGNKNYRDEVIRLGRDIFGDRFRPIVEHMNFDDYTKQLASIDMAIFNHSRQQAMGNIIGLISLGKTVYIRSDITPWSYFAHLGVCVGDTTGEIEMNVFEDKILKSNIQIASQFFTEDRLVFQWKSVFDWSPT